MKKTPQKKISPALLAKDQDGEKRAPSDIAKRTLTVIGKVVGFSKTQKQFGDRLSESTAFRGVFEAQETGASGDVIAVHTATKLFLPQFIEAELEAAFKSSALGDSLSPSVDIAVRIGARTRKDLAVGYEWTAENLLPPQVDALAHLRAAIENKPALPGE